MHVEKHFVDSAIMPTKKDLAHGCPRIGRGRRRLGWGSRIPSHRFNDNLAFQQQSCLQPLMHPNDDIPPGWIANFVPNPEWAGNSQQSGAVLDMSPNEVPKFTEKAFMTFRDKEGYGHWVSSHSSTS